MKIILIFTFIVLFVGCKINPHSISVKFIEYEKTKANCCRGYLCGHHYVFSYKVIRSNNKKYKVGQIVFDHQSIRINIPESYINKYYNDRIGKIINIGDNSSGCSYIHYLGEPNQRKPPFFCE